MPIVERVFSQIQPPILDQEPLPLSDFWSSPAVIVLGDPGAGKSTSFEQASHTEPNSVLVSVRDFLALSLQRWRGKTLYLDGLDEQRAKTRDGTGVLDSLREKLDLLGQPFFRLSCRAADWYGSSDADRLRLVSSDSQITVVRLEPLSDDNIRVIVSGHVPDPDEFLGEARSRHVTDLLRNPQTLNLLLTVVRQGSWPNTRTELYQRACEILGLETNPEHTDYQGPSFGPHEIMTSAGFLCAVHLCGGTAGFSLRAASGDQRFPFIGDFQGNREALAISSRRRIFQTAGPSRIEPIHRTVAEYLAGQFLVERIRESLPLQRVLALITGNDGGTLSDLRGLYAWISCLLTEHAGALIPRDSLGIILYGDASALTLSTKQLILQSLSELAKKNPWFRSESWSSKKPFGGLASSEMEPYFRAVLSDHSAHLVFLYCVFDALQYGAPMPQLGDLVIGIARNSSSDWSIRSEAITTFGKLCPDRVGDLLQLLDDIHLGKVTDPVRELRGDLLRVLYPSTVTTNNIFRYLVQVNENHYGSYNRFIGEELVPNTPIGQLALLVESLASLRLPHLRPIGFIWERFVGRLTLALLEAHGANTPISRLYEWLGHGLDKYGSPIADRQESQQIRSWFGRHPDIVKELFKHWLAITPFSRPRLEIHNFWNRLYNVEPPSKFPQFLVDLSDDERRPEIANFLFRQAIQLSIFRDRPDRLSLDELFQHVQDHPQFISALHEELLSEIPDWKREDATERQQRNRRKTEERETRVRWLSQHEALIRTGGPSAPLVFLANLFYGRFNDLDREQLPEERLITETTQDIANIAKQGFIAALTHPKLQLAREIGETHADSKLYEFGFPVLAGLDVLAAESMDRITRLPSRTICAAIAFHFAHLLDARKEWVDTLFKECPVDSAKGLIAFLQPHFEKATANVPAIYKLGEPVAAAAARLVLPRLLERFPFCHVEQLKVLLSTSLQVLEKPFLLRLIRKVLGIRQRAFTRQHLVLWSAAAFAVSSKIVQDKLPNIIGANVDQANLFLDLLFPEKRGDISFEHPLSRDEIIVLISILGKLFRNKDLSGTGWLGSTKRGKGAQKVRYLIDKLKVDPSFESTSALAKLLENDEIAAGWREYLQYALAEQARLRRETTFSYPTVQKVLRTLSNQQPANSADLQALALDHLKTLKENLRHGPTDGYKTFWNVDHLGRPTKPKPENECRDRLLDLLRPQLLLKSVNAEPEGHYAEDKRADIKALYGQFNLPIEIKRHWHKDLWTAPVNQLRKLYGRDPGAGGRGIYLVFWFGQTVKKTPKPPRSLGEAPVSASELEGMLPRVLSPQEGMLVEVIVFDCTPHGTTRRKRRRKILLAKKS